MRIGELAKVTGTKAETIRYYERERLLLPPPRTSSNYRDYGPEDISRLRFIKRSRKLGFSMAQVKELMAMADDPDQPCETVDKIASAHLREVEAKLADLRALRKELTKVVESCKHGTVAECRVIEVLAGSSAANLPNSSERAAE